MLPEGSIDELLRERSCLLITVAHHESNHLEIAVQYQRFILAHAAQVKAIFYVQSGRFEKRV